MTSPYGRKMEFVFRYQYIGSSWRAYVVSCLDYGTRSTAGCYTHKWHDAEGRYYIDWCGDVKRVEHIIMISRMWAECTTKYIDTGFFG